MSSVRRFQLDELTLRPGTYFNPETEIMIVVDDSCEVDHEIFETEELDSGDWVLLADELPLEETRRDEIVERFQRTHPPGGGRVLDDGDELDADEAEDVDELDEDEGEDELDGVDDLEYGR